MADITLAITVASDKVSTVRDGLDAIHPQPQPDDEGNGGWEGTEKEWYEEVLRRIFARAVRKGLQRAAKAAITVDIYTG